MDVIARTGGLALLCISLVAVSAAHAADPAPHARLIEREGEPRVEVRLLRSSEGTGLSARVGVLFDLAPGWHVYWRSSGDTGLPPRLDWQLGDARVGPVLWPAPRAFQAASSLPGAASYGYAERVLLASELESDPSGSDPLVVEGDVLVCEYECVPASFRLARKSGAALSDLSSEEEDALFREFAGRLPDEPGALGLELSAAWSQTAIRPTDSFEAAIAVRSGQEAPAWTPRDDGPGGAFLPDDMENVDLRSVAVHADPAEPRVSWVELSGSADDEDDLDQDRLTGLLRLGDPTGAVRFVEVDLPFPTAARDADVALLGRHWDAPGSGAGGTGTGLLRAILLALLGGLVLNLMPCVLPVLAIKVFSLSELAEAGRGDPRAPLRQGLAYTAGVLASMAVLAGCVLLLRQVGRSVGWGFQFQEPLYVAAISAVLVAFALNLFGAWEIRGGTSSWTALGRDATGARRSFFEGLLAVALATPCTAPFLGTAVGFAFASPPTTILAIFLAIGIGLAAPFALVAAVPSWARFVPRSGAWMQVVRAGLGFALLATVLWLLWIFGGSAGVDGVVSLAGFLLALAFTLWCFGRLQEGERPRATLAAGAAVLLVGVAGLNVVSSRAVQAHLASGSESRGASSDREAGWESWSPARVAEHLAAGTPVFVRFTADWCITCKVNERVALADSQVHAALRGGGFARLVADWTHRDDRIRSELSRHGRAGVPLYLVYDPARPEAPEMLPELLTPELVVAALERVAHAATAETPAAPQQSSKSLARPGR